MAVCYIILTFKNDGWNTEIEVWVFVFPDVVEGDLVVLNLNNQTNITNYHIVLILFWLK